MLLALKRSNLVASLTCYLSIEEHLAFFWQREKNLPQSSLATTHESKRQEIAGSL
jgi:hypothetical protein